MNVQLKYGIPIMNAVLTTNNDEETSNRTVIKGHEAAEGLLQTIATLKKINQD
jgi:6,7-dimethyl-8-ribityllumazine synthase